MWGLGERLATMRLGLWRERVVRGGFREIKRSLGWHRPGRLDIAAVRRGRDAESRASHSRNPRRAGLVFTADTTNDGSGLAVVVFGGGDPALLDLFDQSRAIEAQQASGSILVPVCVFEGLLDQI